MKNFICLILFICTGCVSLLPPAGPRPQILSLDIKPKIPASLEKVHWSLSIEKPLSTLPLASKSLMVRSNNENNISVLQFLQGVELSDDLPFLLQQRVITAFEQSEKIMAIGKSEEDFISEFILQLDLKQAEIDLTLAQPKTYFEISAKIIRQKDRKIMARHTFQQESLIKSQTQKGFIDAYQQGMGEIIRQIITWTLQKNLHS